MSLLNQPPFKLAPFLAVKGYSAHSSTVAYTTTVPICGFYRDTSFAQNNSNKIEVLITGRYQFNLEIGSVVATGGLTGTLNPDIYIEVVKNSTVLAYYRASFSYAATQTTWTRSGFSYVNDNSGNQNFTTGVLAGSSTTSSQLSGRLVFDSEMDLSSSDLLFLRVILTANSGNAAGFTLSNMKASLEPVT